MSICNVTTNASWKAETFSCKNTLNTDLLALPMFDSGIGNIGGGGRICAGCIGVIVGVMIWYWWWLAFVMLWY